MNYGWQTSCLPVLKMSTIRADNVCPPPPRASQNLAEATGAFTPPVRQELSKRRSEQILHRVAFGDEFGGGGVEALAGVFVDGEGLVDRPALAVG